MKKWRYAVLGWATGAVGKRATRRKIRKVPLGLALGLDRLGRRDHRVDVGQLTAEHPGGFNGFAVTDQERGASGDVVHPERLEYDVEGADGVPVPVREERSLDAECLRPGAVRPRRVSRDRERAHADPVEVVAPVPQELQLGRSGRRPVPDVEAEERKPGTEHLTQRSGLLSNVGPDLDVGNGIARTEHEQTVPTGLSRGELAELKRSRRSRRSLPVAWVANGCASSGVFASIVAMISGQRALEIENRLAELLDVEVDELRDYLAGNIAASTARRTGFRFVRGTHGGQYVRDREGTDMVRSGVSGP